MSSTKVPWGPLGPVRNTTTPFGSLTSGFGNPVFCYALILYDITEYSTNVQYRVYCHLWGVSVLVFGRLSAILIVPVSEPFIQVFRGPWLIWVAIVVFP